MIYQFPCLRPMKKTTFSQEGAKVVSLIVDWQILTKKILDNAAGKAQNSLSKVQISFGSLIFSDLPLQPFF